MPAERIQALPEAAPPPFEPNPYVLERGLNELARLKNAMCGVVSISRARVSRNREQQATAPRGH